MAEAVEQAFSGKSGAVFRKFLQQRVVNYQRFYVIGLICYRVEKIAFALTMAVTSVFEIRSKFLIR